MTTILTNLYCKKKVQNSIIIHYIRNVTVAASGLCIHAYVYDDSMSHSRNLRLLISHQVFVSHEMRIGLVKTELDGARPHSVTLK